MKKFFCYLLVCSFILLGYVIGKSVIDTFIEVSNTASSNDVQKLVGTETSNVYTEDEINENIKKIDEETANFQKEQAKIKEEKKARKRKKTTTKTQNYSGRCLGTTKKGAQCKRKAASGSNYCWQHGG